MARVRMSIADAQTQRFPRVCVKTGEPSESTVYVEAYRTPSWAYLFLIAGLLPGLLVINAVRKRHSHIRLVLPVSSQVAAQRRDRLAVAIAATVGGLVLIFIGAVSGYVLAVWLGIALSASAIVLTALVLNVVGVHAQITRKDEVVINHVHDTFATALERARR